MPDQATHSEFVEAWLDAGPRTVPVAQLVSLFERAFEALWRRTRLTLGDVTLTAIVDRILYTASEEFPFVSGWQTNGSDLRFGELRQLAGGPHDQRIVDVVRFVLVEFLTVLGNLTDEILTPALHAELSRVRADREPGGAGGDDEAEGAT